MGKSKPEDQNVVKFHGAIGMVFGTVIYILGYFIFPFPTPPNLESQFERFAYTFQWQVFSVMTLIVGIQTVSTTRLATTAIDPIGGKGDHHVSVHTRYVQNTLEQLVMSVIGQLILSLYLEQNQMHVVPVLVFLFVFGRVTFWIGYARGYTKRAFGFVLTQMPTMCIYAVVLYHTLRHGPLSYLL